MQSYLDKINAVGSTRDLAPLIGELQRNGIDIFFGYGEQQDFKDASKQIAFIDQAGLGLPERDYYFRTGAKDETIRKQYVEHVAKMLTLAGTPAEKAKKDADAILAFETKLAKASMPITDRRDPEKVYHLQTLATFNQTVDADAFGEFRQAVHSPAITEIRNTNPEFITALMDNLKSEDIDTLKAYMRYHLLTGAANRLPKRLMMRTSTSTVAPSPVSRNRAHAGNAAPTRSTVRSAKPLERSTYPSTSPGTAKPRCSRWCMTSRMRWITILTSSTGCPPPQRRKPRKSSMASPTRLVIPISGAIIRNLKSRPTTRLATNSAASPSKMIASLTRSASLSTITSGA